MPRSPRSPEARPRRPGELAGCGYEGGDQGRSPTLIPYRGRATLEADFRRATLEAIFQLLPIRAGELAGELGRPVMAPPEFPNEWKPQTPLSHAAAGILAAAKTAGSKPWASWFTGMGTPARPDTTLPNTAPTLRFPDCATIGFILLRPLVTNGFTWLRVLDFRPDRNSFLPFRNHPEYLLWGNFRPVQHPGSRMTPGQYRKPITIGGAGR